MLLGLSNAYLILFSKFRYSLAKCIKHKCTAWCVLTYLFATSDHHFGKWFEIRVAVLVTVWIRIYAESKYWKPPPWSFSIIYEQIVACVELDSLLVSFAQAMKDSAHCRLYTLDHTYHLVISSAARVPVNVFIAAWLSPWPFSSPLISFFCLLPLLSLFCLPSLVLLHCLFLLFGLWFSLQPHN